MVLFGREVRGIASRQLQKKPIWQGAAATKLPETCLFYAERAFGKGQTCSMSDLS